MEEIDRRLLKAVKSLNLNKIIKLVDEGANINARDDNGYTPLHWAYKVYYKIIELPIIIFSRKASYNYENHLNSIKMIKYLEEHGADVDAKDCFNRIPNTRPFTFSDLFTKQEELTERQQLWKK